MDENALRKKLPIGDNEKVLAIIKHHWFAYAIVYFGAAALSLVVLVGIIFAKTSQVQLGLSNSAINAVVAFGLIFMVVIIAFTAIPVWIKKQETLVLTEEALMELTKPSLMANNVSQINLQHITDVNVRQDSIGTIFGFGHLTIETPGEQDHYEFTTVAQPRDIAKKIIEAHENYAAALESGQIQTTLGARPPSPGTAWRDAAQYPSEPAPAQTEAPTPVQSPTSDVPHELPDQKGPDAAS